MINKTNRKKEYISIINKINQINTSINKLELQCFNKNSYTNQFINAMNNEVKVISKNIEELKNPFLLFVIGPGKYGKTTLINSLIQDRLLEINEIPNTWKLDRLEYSNKRKIEIHYNNEFKILEYEDGLKFLKEEESKYINSKQIIKKEFDKYKKLNKKTIDELKNYKKLLEEKNLYKSEIEEVRYYIKQGGILNDFVIVDTPGLNQTLKNNTKERMIEYYKRADGVIWILDAQNVVAKCSSELLKELKRDYIVEENFNNIICVVNKIDSINKDSISKVKSKVNELYKSYFKDLVFISSKEALNGYINKDIKLIESSNINNLISSIDTNFRIKSEKIQIESTYNLIKVTINNMNKYIEAYKRQIYLDINKYEQAKRILEEEIYEISKKLELNIKRYISINNMEEINFEEKLKALEDNVNMEINELSERMINMSILDKSMNIEYILEKNINVNISKSRDLISIYRLIKNSKSENIQKNSFIDLYNQITKNCKNNDNKWMIKFKVDSFTKSIIENVNDKLLEIKLDIDVIRDNSFRNKYTDYTLIKNHIDIVNSISNDIKSWG